MRTAWELPLRKSRVVVMTSRDVPVHPKRRDRVRARQLGHKPRISEALCKEVD